MVVGAFRALLAAHGQATWNRSARELGRQGAWILALVVGILAAFAAVGLILGGGALGWLLGGRLDRPVAVTILGAVLAFFGFGGGLIGGVLGGARELAWEAYRGFPLRLRTLYLAELTAGLVDMLPLTMGLALTGLLLGLGLAAPRTLLLVPLVLLETLLMMLALQLLVGGLASALVKRLRVALTALAVLAWLGSTLMSPGLSKRGPGAAARPAARPLQAAQVEKVQALGRGAARVLGALPTDAAARSLAQARTGHWGAALALHLYPLALLALVMVLGARLMAREANGTAAAPQTRGPHRLWSFRHPAEGLGRLHFQTIMRSHLGRFAFLMPLMTVVLLKGPFAQFKANPLWTVPAAFAYLSLVANNFVFNQFGLDRHGVKGLLLLPVGPEDLLKGKLLGLAAHQGLQALVLAGLLMLLDHAGPIPLLGGILLMGCIFLAQTAVGQWTSTWAPRPMAMDSLKNNSMPFALGLLSMGTSAVWAGLFGGAYALLAWISPRLLVPGMALLFGLVLTAHLLLLPAAAAALDRRREKLVEALG
ncbi:hypothetical protein [Geothrix sp. SG200]|uniref:hypothetical protein n=1 Tax=Geothrix sp. SG200 TaxID=2922865 RepID=UPI001FAC9FF9|nr:hypothetical protein [Geothrix sp. SG200]